MAGVADRDDGTDLGRVLKVVEGALDQETLTGATYERSKNGGEKRRMGGEERRKDLKPRIGEESLKGDVRLADKGLAGLVALNVLDLILTVGLELEERLGAAVLVGAAGLTEHHTLALRGEQGDGEEDEGEKEEGEREGE